MSNPKRILIIKTGAAGDVVRTSCLLPVLKDDFVTWITDSSCVPLFPAEGYPHLKIYAIQDIPESLLSEKFHLVLSLEEDEFCAKLASSADTQKLTGIFWSDGISYTKDSSGWFDMSLVSVFGKDIANEKKKANLFSYPELLYAMVGLPFNGEPYQIYQPAAEKNRNLIGIEKTAGRRWPNKNWAGYDKLNDILRSMGYETVFFERKNSLRDYMAEINRCSLIVSGDTLAMHLALAYRIPCVALFNCTSPAEIYDYQLLEKIVSPELNEFFYSTHYQAEAIKAIELSTVLKAILNNWFIHYPEPGQTKAQTAFSGFQP
ncbi:glycosyltransferase family 9 protein [Flavihumibacter profundi]|uniref:glycosyltransferase family 9 protein n=1 Tax=Flavihumibacter profundi TaxID=2716883 RepID=UPI001CC6DF55|nr:glycosyltransferase family 9 protein [Flavihumibacter profundi]MBZ5856240.1 hypothetical protein [Flavihumibacter profundi]